MRNPRRHNGDTRGKSLPHLMWVIGWLILLFGFFPSLASATTTVTALSLSPTSVVGGNSSTGTVTISPAAGGSGQVVNLSSSNTAVATVPPTVTVTSGNTSANFNVSTLGVASQKTSTISAAIGSSKKTALLTVTAAQLQSVNLNPTSVTGGQNVSGSVTLNGFAPSGGAAVSLTCSNNQAAAVGSPSNPWPATVTVAANQNSAAFNLVTSTTNYTTTITLTATYQGSNQNATVTLNPAYLYVTGVSPSAIQLAWVVTNPQSNFTLYRDGTTIATLSSTARSYTDVIPGGINTSHVYFYQLTCTAVNLAEKVQVGINADTDNQAVDSRLDLRYSTNVFLDYCFGSSSYRGGLFAGYASDPSRVGRSFLKFSSYPTPPSGGVFRVGSIACYCTGLYVSAANQNVSVPVGCQALSNTSWSGATMVWDTQPIDGSYNPANATQVDTINYASGAGAPGWAFWSLSDAIQSAVLTSQPLAVALASTTESSSGWAYFAKREYDATLAPVVGMAWDLPIPLWLSVSPVPVMPGYPVTLTVTVNGIGIGNSAVVNLTSSDPLAVRLPSTLTVTGFVNSVTVNAVADTITQITFTATCNGATATITVAFNGGG